MKKWLLELLLRNTEEEKDLASIQTCQKCGRKYYAQSHEYPCPLCLKISDPFHWMEGWLKSHDKTNNSTKGKEVMAWIWDAPTTAG